MKTPNDLFSRLPSVGDLLENPQIKGLVDRVQEMEVATGVRQFVDRMRNEVSRRTLDAPIPSISELADRAARFILGRHTTEQPQAINATGQLWPAGLSGPPLADEALATLTATAQHYHVAGACNAATLAAELTGGQAALVSCSPAATLMLAMASLAEGQSIALARGELATLEGGIRITDLAKQAGATLVEVGAADSVTIDDYRQALEQGANVILRVEALPYALREQTCRPELAELVELAEAHSAKLIHDIGRGPLVPLADSIPLDVTSATGSLSAGISMVIARGDGYVGGPSCGIAIGCRDSIDLMSASPLCGIVRAGPIVEDALAGSLELLRAPDRAVLAIPSLAMLSTPILNLQSRAERMAAQIAEQAGIVSATPIEIPASDDLGATRPLPSFGINILCHQADLARVQTQLMESRPRIIGNWDSDRVLIDLRTVAPAEDIALVAAFNHPPEGE